MFDAAFLEACADPQVKIEIVERFVAAIGVENPLAISITAGNRVILPEPPKTPEEAARLARRFVSEAVVRAGVTQYPVGVGISDQSEITADLFDACTNIGMGTALFGKVYRIVAHAHATEGGALLREAIEAWRTGQFDGDYVFAESDPGPLPVDEETPEDAAGSDADPAPADEASPAPEADTADPNKAGIRVKLPASLGPENSVP